MKKIIMTVAIGCSFMSSLPASEKYDPTAQIEDQLTTWLTAHIEASDQNSIAQVNEMFSKLSSPAEYKLATQLLMARFQLFEMFVSACSTTRMLDFRVVQRTAKAVKFLASRADASTKNALSQLDKLVNTKTNNIVSLIEQYLDCILHVFTLYNQFSLEFSEHSHPDYHKKDSIDYFFDRTNIIGCTDNFSSLDKECFYNKDGNQAILSSLECYTQFRRKMKSVDKAIEEITQQLQCSHSEIFKKLRIHYLTSTEIAVLHNLAYKQCMQNTEKSPRPKILYPLHLFIKEISAPKSMVTANEAKTYLKEFLNNSLIHSSLSNFLANMCDSYEKALGQIKHGYKHNNEVMLERALQGHTDSEKAYHEKIKIIKEIKYCNEKQPSSFIQLCQEKKFRQPMAILDYHFSLLGKAFMQNNNFGYAHLPEHINDIIQHPAAPRVVAWHLLEVLNCFSSPKLKVLILENRFSTFTAADNLLSQVLHNQITRNDAQQLIAEIFTTEWQETTKNKSKNTQRTKTTKPKKISKRGKQRKKSRKHKNKQTTDAPTHRPAEEPSEQTIDSAAAIKAKGQPPVSQKAKVSSQRQSRQPKRTTTMLLKDFVMRMQIALGEHLPDIQHQSIRNTHWIFYRRDYSPATQGVTFFLKNGSNNKVDFHISDEILYKMPDQYGTEWDFYHSFPTLIDRIAKEHGQILQYDSPLLTQLDVALEPDAYAVVLRAKIGRGRQDSGLLSRKQFTDISTKHDGYIVYLIDSQTDNCYHRMFHQASA